MPSPPRSQESMLALPPGELFIAGEWRAAASGARFAVEDPATGAELGQVADAGADDALAALAAADDAFATWRQVAPRERGELLRRACEALTADAERVARLITLEAGKPLADARAEIAYAASYLRWYAEEAVRIDGRSAVSETGDGRFMTLLEPVGPCLFITPWNFPLAMGARKLAPALAAGCTAVVKPADQTPFSMLALARILADAGMPAGVVNVVTTSSGPATTAPLIADPRLRKLSFTGSSAAGRLLVAQAAEQLLRLSMELGGNAPFLVFPDADLDAAVEGALLAKMRNGGAACTSANRFCVHRSIADAFAERLADRIGSLRVGRGLDAGVEVGPLIDERQRRRVAELVDDARARGSEVLVGGEVLDGPGYFYAPTVLRASADARLLREEIFGPVAPVVAFDDEDEAIAQANDTEYGLVAYLYTRDVDRAFRVAERLRTGMVGLNRGILANAGAPFGGVKQSGFGREGGPEGLREYLDVKYLALGVPASS